MNKKTIVILGGMGPMAGLYLHKLIITLTESDGTDQSHLPIFHLSVPTIPDRTEFLLKNSSVNPADILVNVLKQLSSASFFPKEMIIGISCSTFHSPLILNKFKRIIKKQFGLVDVQSIIDSTVTHLKVGYPRIRRVGILTTSGSREAEVYRRELRKSYHLIEISKKDQDLLQKMIYNPTFGLKAKSCADLYVTQVLNEIAEKLFLKGAEVIILGCTELPLAFLEKKQKNCEKFFNPMEALALDLIKKSLQK